MYGAPSRCSRAGRISGHSRLQLAAGGIDRIAESEVEFAERLARHCRKLDGTGLTGRATLSARSSQPRAHRRNDVGARHHHREHRRKFRCRRVTRQRPGSIPDRHAQDSRRAATACPAITLCTRASPGDEFSGSLSRACGQSSPADGLHLRLPTVDPVAPLPAELSYIELTDARYRDRTGGPCRVHATHPVFAAQRWQLAPANIGTQGLQARNSSAVGRLPRQPKTGELRGGAPTRLEIPPGTAHCTRRDLHLLRNSPRIAHPSSGTHHAESAAADTIPERSHSPWE